ncbi:hypothetical protein D3C85_455560 [compost metagenome]
MASRVSRFTLKPNSAMMAAPPSMDSGMVTTGTSTARSDPRHRNITATTMAMASSSVRVTPSIDALMKRASSNGTCTLVPGGRFCLMPGSSSFRRFTMTRGLPTGVAFRPKYTAGSPSIRPLESAEAAPSSTVATSPSRTIAPLSRLTTRSRNSATLTRSVLIWMLETTYRPLACPGAACTLFSRSASASSPAEMPRAAMRFGSSQTRIASFCPPYSSTLATPSMDESCGCTTRDR